MAGLRLPSGAVCIAPASICTSHDGKAHASPEREGRSIGRAASCTERKRVQVVPSTRIKFGLCLPKYVIEAASQLPLDSGFLVVPALDRYQVAPS